MAKIPYEVEKEGRISLTVKDKRILGELFQNARTPFSVIARKVRLSKEAVNYRVKRLMNSGLLAGFNTVLDVRKLGWEMFFVYIRLRNIDVGRESTIFEFLKGHPNVTQLFKCVGNYDAIVKVFVRQTADVDALMKDIEARFPENIDQYDIDYVVEEAAVPFAFLYDVGRKQLQYLARGEPGKVDVSGMELKLLKQLAKNARISLADIAIGIGTSRDNVKYHLKRLEKAGVILKYRPDTLPKKLGYNWHFLVLKTGKLDDRTNRLMEGFLLNHPNVTYFYRTVRNSDVQIELRAKTTEQLNDVLMELRGILKAVLRRVDVLTILHEHKYTYVPDCLLHG